MNNNFCLWSDNSNITTMTRTIIIIHLEAHSACLFARIVQMMDDGQLRSISFRIFIYSISLLKTCLVKFRLRGNSYHISYLSLGRITRCNKRCNTLKRQRKYTILQSLVLHATSWRCNYFGTQHLVPLKVLRLYELN